MRREQPWKTNRARVLRFNSTSAENKLWSKLRNRQLDGLRFTRQMPVGATFADFVCRSHMVIVEIDGATHATPLELANDAIRTGKLEALGYRILRVNNEDVRRNVTGVLDAILAFAKPWETEPAAAPHPALSPSKRGEGARSSGGGAIVAVRHDLPSPRRYGARGLDPLPARSGIATCPNRHAPPIFPPVPRPGFDFR